MSRWFIHSVQHYKPKNDKVREAQRFIDSIKDSLVEGPTPFISLLNHVKYKCAELDSRYPRTKPLTVLSYSNATITIYCGDAARSAVESGHIAVTFNVSPVKRSLIFYRDRLIFKDENKDRTGQADILAKHCITDKTNRNE